MFRSSAPAKKQPEKKYLTLVMDHAIKGDRHVAFEIGGGICGSGFPDYDIYMSQVVKPIEFNGQSYPCKSLMRRKMIESLAKQVKYLYVVNASTEILLESVGLVWLHHLGNVRYHQSLENFCKEALAAPHELEDCALIIDRSGEQTYAVENDYAAVLHAMGINIPVINEGAYKIFDEKVTFTTLFDGDQSTYLPKTWIVDDKNYQSILKEIDTFPAKDFILKLPAMSHARDTVIANKNQLRAIVEAIITKDARKIPLLNLTAKNIECLKTFVEVLYNRSLTFLIREVVLPDPVLIGKHAYRTAARSVFTVVYYSANKTLLHIDLLDSYWQRPAKPYKQGEAISHDNLITFDAQSGMLEKMDRSAIITTTEQHAELAKEFLINPTWTDEQKTKHGPAVLAMAKTIVRGAFRANAAETVLALAKHPNKAIANHMHDLVLHKPVQCFNGEEFQRVMQLSHNHVLFLSRQLMIALHCYHHFNNLKAMPDFIIKSCDQAFTKNQIKPSELAEYIVTKLMKLPDEKREALIKHIASISVIVGDFLRELVENAKLQAQNAIKELHPLALKAYKAQQYDHAIQHWSALLIKLEDFLPESIEILSAHNNLAAAYRDKGDYRASKKHFVRAIITAQYMQRQDLAEKYNEKLYQLKVKEQTSKSTPSSTRQAK